MQSQASLPATPSRRRTSLRLSSFDVPIDSSPSPYTSGTTNGTTFSRRSSRTSQTSYQIPSPTTPRPMSSRSSRRQSFQHRRKSSSRLSVGSNMSLEQMDNGLGNLADELEDALDDEYEGQETSFLDGLREGSMEPSVSIPTSPYGPDHPHDFSSAVNRDPPIMHESLRPSTPAATQTSKADKRKSRHQRIESRYDGSDYGPDTDQEDDADFPPALVRRIHEIESLARISTTEDTLSEGGGAIKRTTTALRDLGPQSNLENSLSRIIAAYTSIATHRTHKTRDLFTQAHSLLYHNISHLPPETIETLLSSLDTLSTSTPIPHQNPLPPLQLLASQTQDLSLTLRGLTDHLHESRISANAAARKLKSVRDMVEEMRVEEELVEMSVLLIQAGDWDRRCRERKAAECCREVVVGFGERWGLEVEGRTWVGEGVVG